MENIGRRERKKLETAGAIEWAALYLAHTDGLDNVTVEAISDRADVTSRTFFNYFASKEDAVLGITRASTAVMDDPAPDGAGTAFELTTQRIRQLLATTGHDDLPRTRMRREVVKNHPSLIAHEYFHLTTKGNELLPWVESLVRLENDAVTIDVTIAARTIVHTIGAAYQVAAHAWSIESGGGRSLVEHFDDALASISRLFQNATTR
jgi:AcrR family transcriptional regulator